MLRPTLLGCSVLEHGAAPRLVSWHEGVPAPSPSANNPITSTLSLVAADLLLLTKGPTGPGAGWQEQVGAGS